MSSPEKIQAPWIDIQALPVPVEEISITTILITILGLVLLLAIIRYIWQQPRLIALRKIRHLQKQSYSSRQQLFLLQQALQQGLQVSQLQKKEFSSHRQSEWQAFCHMLVRCCYQAAPPANDDVIHLVTQARYWVKQA